jgi:uncharacterized protein (TIGR02099 family)
MILASWLPILRRVLKYTVAAAVLAFALLVSALRWWILPEITHYRADIETQISKAAGQKITIGAIDASWLGLRPYLKLGQVVVHDHAGQPALTFERVDATLSWYSLLVAELRLYRLEITRPRIEVKREPDGMIYVSGMALNNATLSQGFSDWVLRQEIVQINHATFEWRDNLRAAPPLILNDVGLLLENSGKHHRFGLLASPPRELASSLDVRGDLHGASLHHLPAWSGVVYANLGDTDISAWGAWVDLPYRINQGHGALQLWTEFKQGQLSAVSALVQLQGVKTRLGKNLPELDVAQLNGLLSWHMLARGFEFEAKRIALDAGAGRRLAMQNLLAHFEAAEGTQPEQGEFRAGNIEIAPLLALAEYLPLSEEQRKQLKDWSPQGTFKTLALTWLGPKAAPQEYSLQGDFANLGIQALGKLPGFANISGTLQADQKGGALKLAGKHAALDMPLVFRQALQFDEMSAAARWRINNQRVRLTIDKANFSNAQVSGNLSGQYESAPGGAGYADIAGRLTRADVTAVYQYLPRVIGEQTYTWLQNALVKGVSDDVRVKLKGDLNHFPFASDRNGVFQVTAKVKDGVLQYAPDWPRIEQIQTALDFHGNRMEINASQGAIFNTQISRAKIVIPDLASHDAVLEVDGATLGATPDLLRFINASPVGQQLDTITQQINAEGTGKLELSLRMPLHRLHDTRVAGSYQFAANKLWISTPGPVLEQASGKLAFTERTVTIPKISAQLLGGPVTISANTVADGMVRVSAAGRVSGVGLQQAYPGVFTQHLKGGTGWSASMALRKQAANVVLVSNLTGLASELPYPLSKAPQESLPLKFERRFIDTGHDAITLSLGKVLSAQFLRTTAGGVASIEKGQIHFGGTAVSAPTQAGVWLNGELEKFDADLWNSFVPSTKGEPPVLALAGVQLKIKTLDLLGHRLNNFYLNAVTDHDIWQASVDSDEMQGDVNWREHDGGRLLARFKQLTYPDAAPARGVPLAGGRDFNLPALDIVIDDFQLKKAKLGKVEVLTSKQGVDWRIERLRITNPDASFYADGVWQSWLVQPQSKLSMDLDVKDVGKLLARMGYPDRIKSGTAKLTGNLSWHGSPQAFNLATLSGDMKLEAHRGQFMKLDPGAGKLLGLLSLQSLPRRLTLDFRDVFSKGFAFDTILGVISVKQGVMTTNDFVMQGPAAVVTMTGTTDLVQEMQNLRVKVVPVVGDSVSVLAFLGGPVVGIGTYILQKLLKDPLGKIVAHDYAVTGTWENPTVLKIESKPQEFAQ